MTREEQDREALDRLPMTIEGEREADPHQDYINDNTGEGHDDPAPQERARRQDEREDDEPVVDRRSPADIQRAEIAKRFRRNADVDEGEVPFNGDPNDPEMLYGVSGRQGDQEPDDEPSVVGSHRSPEPAPERRVELTIRGKKVFLTEAEVIARAQKVEAADSYLEEGRRLLEEAQRINKAQRTGRDRHHPDDAEGANDDHLELAPDEADQHPDELVQAIEEIQFGDPKEAATKIRKVIARASDESADQRQLDRLMKNDLANSQKALKSFEDQNPDLAKDETAAVVITKHMLDLYRDDITKMGIDPSQIPNDPERLANWHRFYRVNGHPVRPVPVLLEEAKKRFVSWRGGKGAPTPSPRLAPRVEVNVDRTTRREAIPVQPTRAVAPRPDSSGRSATPARTRADVVMQMRKSRGQVTI